MTAEISYDLIMADDMAFIEGTYRLNAGTPWQVMIFSKASIDDIQIKEAKWSSGVTCVSVKVPRSFRLSKENVEQTMASWLGVDQWSEVRGPDSMQLR